MKKKGLLLALASTLLLSGAGTAKAALINVTDRTWFNTDLNWQDRGWKTQASEDYVSHGGTSVGKLENADDYVEWIHRFDVALASNPGHKIKSAKLSLYLRDDKDIVSEDPTDEFAFVVSDDGIWDLGRLADATEQWYGKLGINTSALMDGMFNVNLKSTRGDFYIIKSDLKITYAPVPEPSTMLLLSGGLVAMWRSRRKKEDKAE